MAGRPRSWRALAPPVLLAGLAAGCGSSFPLPTETRQDAIPTDQSYQLLSTWKGFAGVRDLLLTQGRGSQLFMVFNFGGTGLAPRGEVRLYPRFSPVPVASVTFGSVFSPAGIASGGGRLVVLDEGDTTLARDPVTRKVVDFEHYWRVREYGLLGGDTLSTFTDTTVAAVKGIAADNAGNVYVSCIAIVLVPNQDDPRILTREFQARIYLYRPGPLPGGRPDRRMPGSNWHRDSLYVVLSGTGTESVGEPRGIFWSNAGGYPTLYVSDFGNNAAKKLSADPPVAGFLSLDGAETGTPFNGVQDVAADLAGYFYVVDAGDRRVLRYSDSGTFIQRVNVELDGDRDSLHLPVAVAVDDSLAYVFDSATGKVQLYRRRK